VLLVFGLAAWTASCTTLSDISAPSRAFSLSATSASFGTQGGAGNIAVQAPSSCAWTVTASAPWVALTSAPSGNGDGTISFTVAANGGAATRDATLSVSGQAFTVSQSGTAPSCTYAVAPSSAAFTSKSGSGTITVTTDGGCAWTATTEASWITINSGRNGTGNGAVRYTVKENKSKNGRSGTVIVAGRSVTISQANEN
jgi:hypothetical protein